MPGIEQGRRVLIVRGTVWSAGSEWARWCIIGIVLIVVAQLVGPKGLGLVAMAGIVTALGYAFVRNQLLDSLVQIDDLEPGHITAMFFTVLGFGFLIAALLIALAFPAANLFGEPLVAPLILAHSPAIIVAALSAVPAALLRRSLRVDRVAQASLASAVVGGATGIGLALANAGVWSLVGMQIAGVLTESLALWFRVSWRPCRTTWRHFQDLLHFNLSVIGVYILDYLNYQGPRFLVSLALGTTAVGQFVLARRFLELLNGMVTRPVQAVAFPTLAHFRRESGRFRETYMTGIRLAALITYPSFLGFGLIAPALINIAFSDDWAPVAGLVPILVLSGLRSPTFVVNNALMRAQGFPHLQGLHLLASALFGAAFVGLALILETGLIGVVLALIARDAVLWPLIVVLARRASGIGALDQLRPCFTPFLATVVMVSAVLLLQLWMGDAASDLTTIFGSIAVGVSVYAIAISVLDQNLVRQLIRLTVRDSFAKV